MYRGKICPKCHYQRKQHDDKIVPENECPNCGIIYSKFISVVNKKPQNNLYEGAQSHGNNSYGPNFDRKKISVYAGLFIALVIIFIIIQHNNQANTFPPNVKGTYIGKLTKNNGESLSVEFDVSEKYRVSRLLIEHTRTLNWNIENRFLWNYPDRIQIDYSLDGHLDDSERRAVSFRKEGKTTRLEVSTFQPELIIKSAFANESKEVLSETGMLKAASIQGVFYSTFNLNVSNPQSLQIGQEELDTSPDLGSKELCRYCKACSKANEILYAARGTGFYTYSWSSSANNCSVNIGNLIRLKFKIIPENLQSELQDAFNHRKWETDISIHINDSSIALEVFEHNPLIRISINNNGYGQFDSTECPRIPVRRIGQDLSDEESNKSANEWESIFINKNDPRIKYNLGGKAREKAFSSATKAIKRAAQEQNGNSK